MKVTTKVEGKLVCFILSVWTGMIKIQVDGEDIYSTAEFAIYYANYLYPTKTLGGIYCG